MKTKQTHTKYQIRMSRFTIKDPNTCNPIGRAGTKNSKIPFPLYVELYQSNLHSNEFLQRISCLQTYLLQPFVTAIFSVTSVPTCCQKLQRGFTLKLSRNMYHLIQESEHLHLQYIGSQYLNGSGYFFRIQALMFCQNMMAI